MMKTLFYAAKNFTIFGIIFIIILPFLGYAGDVQQPYYGFYPSEKGSLHKQFVHNLFGFSIDIPSTWVFGVNGNPPTTVVLLYPEGLNTGKFSNEYEIIEIGHLPFNDISLEDGETIVTQGMKASHSSYTIVQKPQRKNLNGMPAITWQFEWVSETGYTVYEYITILESKNGMRSLAVRTTRGDFSSRLSFYNEIIETFQPFEPKF